MKPLIAVVFAVVGAVAVMDAQSPATQSQGRGQRSQPLVAPVPDPPAQTVSGCLKQSPDVPGRYVLAEATQTNAGQAGGSTGTSGSKSTYAIVGMIPPDVKLGQHVNHRVELSGTIVENTKFDVRSLKMVAASCP
jgi:hypothetical protein